MKNRDFSIKIKINPNPRVFDILLKEDFRQFILKHNQADHYMIDTPGYTSVPNVIACFSSNGEWKVYQTDDRAQPFSETSFSDAGSAYENAAQRRGLQFSPSQTAQMLTLDSLENSLRLKQRVKNALKNTEAIASLLEGEQGCEDIKKDIPILESTLNDIQKITARFTKLQNPPKLQDLIQPQKRQNKWAQNGGNSRIRYAAKRRITKNDIGKNRI